MGRPIEVRITGDNKSALFAIGGTEAGLKDLSKTAEKTTGGLGRLKSVLGGLGAAAAAGAAFSFLKDSVKASGDLEQSMNVLLASLGKVGPAADTARSSLGTLAKELGGSTVYNTQQVTDAMTDLAKAGLSINQIKTGGIAAALDIAATEGLELSDAAATAANAMTMFGLSAKDLPAVADALAGAANASTASVKSLAYGLQQVGPGAKQSGLSLQETVAALAAFEQHGVKGSDAGTSFKTMLASLVGKSDDARGAIHDFGLEFVNADGSFRSLSQIAETLQTNLGGLSEEERKLALNQIFGSDASRAAAILMEEGAKGINKYIKATKDKNAAERLAEARTKGYNGAMEKLGGSFDNLKIAVGDKFKPVLTDLANVISDDVLPKVTSFVEGLDFSKIGKFVEGLGPKIQTFAEDVKNALAGIDTEQVKSNLSGLQDALGTIGGAGKSMFEAFQGMSPEAKKNIALIIAAGVAFKVAQRNPVVKIGVDLVSSAVTSIASTVASALAQRIFGVTQRVFVTNMPTSFGGGGGTDRDGKPKGGKVGQVGLGLAAVAAAVLPMIIDKLPLSPGFKETVSRISEGVAVAGSAAWVATALGLSNPIGWVVGITAGITYIGIKYRDQASVLRNLSQYTSGGFKHLTEESRVQDRKFQQAVAEQKRRNREITGDVEGEVKARRAGDESEAARRRKADVSEAEHRLFGDRSEGDRRRSADAKLAADVAGIDADIRAVRAYFTKVERLVTDNVMVSAAAARTAPMATPQGYTTYAPIYVQTVEPTAIVRRLKAALEDWDVTVGRAPGAPRARAW